MDSEMDSLITETDRNETKQTFVNIVIFGVKIDRYTFNIDKTSFTFQVYLFLFKIFIEEREDMLVAVQRPPVLANNPF